MRHVCVATLGTVLLAGCAQPYQPLYVAPPRPLPAWETPPLAALVRPPMPMPMPAPTPEPAPEPEPTILAEPVAAPDPAPDAPTPAPTVSPPPFVKPASGPAVPMMGFRPMRGQSTGL